MHNTASLLVACSFDATSAQIKACSSFPVLILLSLSCLEDMTDLPTNETLAYSERDHGGDDLSCATIPRSNVPAESRVNFLVRFVRGCIHEWKCTFLFPVFEREAQRSLKKSYSYKQPQRGGGICVSRSASTAAYVFDP